LLLTYSHCIAQGINMTTAMTHQKEAVQSGFWPLYRYDPRLAQDGQRPFQLDSRKPKLPFEKFAMQEARFAMLARTDPARAKHLFELAQADIDDTWNYYSQMAAVERKITTQFEEVES
jgi:pyruvate-ferredoxin/flavodoxin oxidoreductase